MFLTVWDGGGNDTYDFSNYTTNLHVDLRPGEWTLLSDPYPAFQLAHLGDGGHARGNIANAWLYQDNTASIIENAISGVGDDQITADLSFEFIGRVDPSITRIKAGMRLSWDSRIFDIEQALEFEERGWWISMIATERLV